MKAFNPKALVSLYNWLPSYGENSVKLVFKENELRVEINFDSRTNEEEQQKVFFFKNVCHFHFSSIPSINLLNIDYSKIEDLGSLNEYEYSDVAKKWNRHFGYNNNEIKHFVLLFLSVNKRLEVFSESFTIS
jgi:hypothetical protein